MTSLNGFSGFGEGAVEFYDGLLADNSKAYWSDHREVYENDVRAPMLALLAELEAEFGPGKIFRPYRDLRFSTDKQPYKTHCGGYAPPYYVQLSAEGLLAGAGYYVMASDQLARYRAAVAEDRRGEALQAIIARSGMSLAGERLKTRPKGVGADHPRLELLRHKGVYLSRSWPPDDVLHEPGCAERVRQAWRAARPLAEWLADHVGPSEQPGR